MPERRRPLASLVVASLLLVACGDGSDRSSGRPSPSTSVDGERIVGALCAAREAADEDPAAARRAFLNGAHGPIHDLARDVAEVDRAVAASLHEAKQRTEAAVEDASADGSLAAALATLTDATRASLDRLDQPVPSCDDRSR